MKTKLAILTAILAISLPAFAQDFSFTYDATGNRTNRNIITLNKSTTIDTTIVNEETATEEEPGEDNKLHEKLGSFELAVYPNPTKGEVVLEIAGGESFESASYKVFDLSGREILAGATSSSPISVNLSGQVAGTYFLVVNINGEEKSWKVVKE